MAIYKGLTRLREASYGKTPVAFIYWGAEQVWRFVKGFIYTTDEKALVTKDGLYVKCKDQD